MDKTPQYTEIISNFDSAYNISPKPTPPRIMYIPMSSSTTCAPFHHRSSSPLFRRCISPPPRPVIVTGTAPKFNFDLYKMDENNNEYTGYSSPSYRAISASSSRIIHHYPVHSPPSSPTSTPEALSKLRQMNDELCRTLAQSEVAGQPSSAPHYHIHHYPISQHRSRSTSRERRRSIEREMSPKVHKPRITYKIHIPRRDRHRKSSRHTTSSDEYSSEESVTIDLYPARDQGFERQSRQHQNPWLLEGKSLRRSSYSGKRTSRTRQGPYYGDKPIKSYRRSNRDKKHHQSPYISSRIRPESAPLDASDQYYQSNGSFSNNTSPRRPSGSIKQPRFVDSDGLPRTNSPSSKPRERVWHPPSKTTSQRAPKYFHPTLKPEYDESTGKYLTDGTESEPVSQRKPLSDRTKIRTNDPKLKKRIKDTESKVKSAWEPTVTGFGESTVRESKPSAPLPAKKSAGSTPPKSKVKFPPSDPATPTKKVVRGSPTTTNTGRSTIDDVPARPVHTSTPKNEQNTHKNDDSVDEPFKNESHTSEPSEKQQSPQPPSPIERKPTPQKPSTELPKTTVPEPDRGTKPTITNGVLIRGNHNQNPMPSPISDIHDAQTKPNNENDRSVVVDDDDRDENDDEVANSFDMNNWLSKVSNVILGPSKNETDATPSNPQPATKPKAKSPPRRREPPPSPPTDENLYKPPFGPKKADQKPSKPSPPPAPTTEVTSEVDDFFT